MKKTTDRVFVLVKIWKNAGDNTCSPVITVFSNIKAARKRLLELVEQDNKNGITSSIDDECEDWKVDQDQDWYHAWNEEQDTWIDMKIDAKFVYDKSTYR